jgi:hypothetical protein
LALRAACGTPANVLRLVIFFLTALAALACSRSHRVGDEVMVEWEGKEYPAVILSADATKYRVHFKDLDDQWDQDVLKSRVKGFAKGDEIRPEPPAKVREKAMEASQSNTYRVGDMVRVQWSDGRYYPATIIDVVGKEHYRVHFEGYGKEWDENVRLSRIQPK